MRKNRKLTGKPEALREIGVPLSIFQGGDNVRFKCGMEKITTLKKGAKLILAIPDEEAERYAFVVSTIRKRIRLAWEHFRRNTTYMG
jgi:hypothetical protein